MGIISQNLGDSQEAKYRLAFHIILKRGIKLKRYIDRKVSRCSISLNQSFLTSKNLTKIGEGAQGLVLLAKDQNTKIRYAIKGVQVRDPSGILDNDLIFQIHLKENNIYLLSPKQ